MALLKNRRKANSVFVHIGLIIICCLLNFPVFWMVATSLKGGVEAMQFPPSFLPTKATLENYRFVWTEMKFSRYFLNTIYVSGLTVLVTLAVGLTAGYSFARFRIKRKQELLISILFFRMLPPVLFIMPLFFLIQKIGLFDRLEGVVLSLTTIALPFAVWMMKNYFETIPKEIEEAAIIDGCSRFQAFFRVMLPLATPGVAATAVFCFLSAWNEFMFANTLIHSEARRTLVVALYAYVGEFLIEWNKLMAASILTMIPVVVFFFLIHKHLSKGFSSGSVKG
ncbi:MAG: carbohydrate ABC transporter permease [Spirochaetales bacterium]|nr:carbohydrate ABC transporter permease [Spirochaetales bacterium]